MTTATETYNGWANYPTWCVNLWLGNDRGSYEWAMELVRDEYRDAPHCVNVREGIWTVEEARRFNLADRLREEIEEAGVEVDSGHTYPVRGQLVGFGSDLYGWALQHVDWHEIAEHWLADYAEEAEDDA